MRDEPRDYTYDRGQEQDPVPPEPDPSTKAGFTAAVVVIPLLVAAVAFLIGFLVTGLIWGWERAPHVGFSAALVAGVLAGLLAADREDGRVAREGGERGGQA